MKKFSLLAILILVSVPAAIAAAPPTLLLTAPEMTAKAETIEWASGQEQVPVAEATQSSRAVCSEKALHFEVANTGMPGSLLISSTQTGGRIEISDDNVWLKVEFAWDPRASIEELADAKGRSVFATATVNLVDYDLGRVVRLENWAVAVEMESAYRSFQLDARLSGALDLVRDIRRSEGESPETPRSHLAALDFIVNLLDAEPLDPESSRDDSSLRSAVVFAEGTVECVPVNPHLCLCWYCWECAIIFECCSVPTEYPGSCR